MASKTFYEFLLEKQENGELEILFSMGLNRAKILQMMKIYAYHLSHPNASQWDVCLELDVSKKTVWNTYRFMKKSTGDKSVVTQVVPFV